VPPGSLGLMLQPFWNPGIKVPGPEAKGAVIGFGEVHTRAHLYRAILEGLAYALREGKERIERRGGTRIERVRVSGGGSQSDAAMQITANVFNLPTERPHLFETSGLGAAIVAAVGLGLHPDFATAVREMTRVGRVFARKRRTCEPTTSSTGKCIAACTGRLAAALPRHPRHHRLSRHRVVAAAKAKSPPQGWAGNTAKRWIRRRPAPGSAIIRESPQGAIVPPISLLAHRRHERIAVT
jgi:hypothetical protein